MDEIHLIFAICESTQDIGKISIARNEHDTMWWFVVYHEFKNFHQYGEVRGVGFAGNIMKKDT